METRKACVKHHITRKNHLKLIEEEEWNNISTEFTNKFSTINASKITNDYSIVRIPYNILIINFCDIRILLSTVKITDLRIIIKIS